MLAAIGPALAPYNPLVPDPIARLQPPSASRWFGTDHLGRDVLCRVPKGARHSVGLTVLMVLSSALVSLVICLAAGAGRRFVDAAPMRLTDAFFALPELIAALAVAVVVASRSCSRSRSLFGCDMRVWCVA